MLGAKEKMAKSFLVGLVQNGIEVKLYNISISDKTEIIKELLDTKWLIIGSSTHNNNILPNIAGFLDFIKGLRLKGRCGASFGFYGWSGESVKIIENILKESGIEIVLHSISVKYMPSEDDLKNCYELGKTFGGHLLS